MASMATTSKPPMAPSGLRRTKRARLTRASRIRREALSVRGPARSKVVGPGASPTGAPPSLVADSRIEDGIEGVDGEVDQDDGGDHDQVHALDHRVVPLVDGVEEETAHAGQ